MKTRISCIIPDIMDPTSWYRGAGPLSEIEKRRDDLELAFPQNINWSTLKFSHILFMQRPHLPDYFNAMVMAKDHHIPVWIDFDDDNLSVPKDNPSYSLYSQQPIKDAIVKMTRHAEVVTVATMALKKKFDIYRPKGRECIVVPNALDDKLLIHRAIAERPRDKMVIWRGSTTHKRNLDTVKNEIVKVAKAHLDWKFTFFGYDPIDITDQIRNFALIQTHHIVDYFKVLVSMHASCMFYALANNDHSKARSHVSWLEASFAGMPVIAPKMAEFERPGILNFATPEEFEMQLEAVIKGEVDIKKLADDSWAHIQEFYMLSHVNKMRENIIEGLRAVQG